MFTQHFLKSEFSIQNLVLYSVSNQFMYSRYKPGFFKGPPLMLCSYLLSILSLFLYFNNVSIFKIPRFFPLFKSLNIIFLYSFNNLLMRDIFHICLSPYSHATALASFPYILLYEFYLFIFFIYMPDPLSFCYLNNFTNIYFIVFDFKIRNDFQNFAKSILSLLYMYISPIKLVGHLF